MIDAPEVKTTVHGNAQHGFIVELHDGDRAMTHGSMAATPEAAEAEAREAWDKEPDPVDGVLPVASPVTLDDVHDVVKEHIADLPEPVEPLTRDDVRAIAREEMQKMLAAARTPGQVAPKVAPKET